MRQMVFHTKNDISYYPSHQTLTDSNYYKHKFQYYKTNTARNFFSKISIGSAFKNMKLGIYCLF